MIVAFGTMALDSVETPGGRVIDEPGGSALYFAAAASLLAPVGLLGVVGSDYPWSALNPLLARGVDVEGIERRQGPTMRWRARYGSDLEERETIGTTRGVAESEAPAVPLSWRGAPTLFLGSTDPGLQNAVLERVAPTGLVVLDTMEHWIRERRAEVAELASRCDVLLLNEREAALLGGDHGEDEGAPTLLSLGPAWVVVKRGRRGAHAFSGGEALEVPAAAGGRVVDPTGAGDAFAGGLTARLHAAAALDRTAMEDALRHGSAAAALAVQDFGMRALTRGGPADR